MATYYERPNAKRDVTKRYSNSNGKQEANNKEFKVFCGCCDLEITSRKNDKSGNKDFCIMIFKAWLKSWLWKSKIFHIKNIDFDIKNLLNWLNSFPLLFSDLYWAKKTNQKYKRKISWNSHSGHYKLPFDNIMSVNKNIFRFNKTTLQSTITNVC